MRIAGKNNGYHWITNGSSRRMQQEVNEMEAELKRCRNTTRILADIEEIT